MNPWNRDTFRTGKGEYQDLNAAPREGEGGQERGDGKQGDGRGDAILDGAPKPQPGDELYDTLYRARSEQTERATYARQEAGQGSTTAAEFAIAIVLTARGYGQDDRTREMDEQAQQVTREASRSRPAAEATQQPTPTPEQSSQTPDRGGLYAMRAQQAAAEIEQQPGQQQEQQRGLMADFVTPETRTTNETEREQTQQRTRTMGLSL